MVTTHGNWVDSWFTVRWWTSAGCLSRSIFFYFFHSRAKRGNGGVRGGAPVRARRAAKRLGRANTLVVRVLIFSVRVVPNCHHQNVFQTDWSTFWKFKMAVQDGRRPKKISHLTLGGPQVSAHNFSERSEHFCKPTWRSKMAFPQKKIIFPGVPRGWDIHTKNLGAIGLRGG